MGRSAAADKRFLEQHRGKWRVVVPVPRALHKRLGTKLKKALHTDSLAVANQLKWAVVHELREIIRSAAATEGTVQSLTREALELAALRARADADAADLEFAIRMRADQLAGEPLREEIDQESGERVFVYDKKRLEQAGLYAAMARGEATPLKFYLDQYMQTVVTKPRTRGDDTRAVAFLQTWCEQNGVRPTLQAITRKVAALFVDGLHTVAPGRDNVTLNKYPGRLRQYWAWLVDREFTAHNVWIDQSGKTLKRKVAPTLPDEQERPFTDAEIVKLLEGAAPPALRDVMLIGALTGARLDVIVSLRVKDCEDGLFVFQPQKREKKPRAVPIHPDLKALVQRRVAGKTPDDSLFPEWPAPKKAGSKRERSFKTSNAFTAYRRAVGVDERVEGKRRARVNFHSFRRWFITKAEQADQPESIIAVVVGHKRTGMTLGRYSGGPLMEQARRCVEAVKLPKHTAPKDTDRAVPK